MRIGIDARQFSNPRGSGVAVYLRNIVEDLVGSHPEHSFFLYGNRPFLNAPTGRGVHLREGQGRLPGSIWAQTSLPRLAKRDNLDVFWGPQQVLPLPLPRRIPAVVTIHDLTYQLYPQTMSVTRAAALRFLVPRSISRAACVITDAEDTRDRLKRLPETGSTPVEAIPLGVSPLFRPRSSESTHPVRERYGLDRPYLLTVGTLEPRKNLETVLKSFGELRAGLGWNGQLAVAGSRGWRFRVREEDHVRWLGYVTDDELPDLYSGAEAFVISSLYEGFGLPILEAMACGTPVFCSDIAVFREVAGEEAIRFPPREARTLADQLHALLTDPERKGRLSIRSRRRAEAFSWRRTAKMTMEALVRACRNRNPS